MKRSTFSLHESELDQLAVQYWFDMETNRAQPGSKTNEFKFGSQYESGGAGCITTVDDYILFLEALRTYRLLKPETVKMMVTDCLTEKQKEMYANSLHVAKEYSYGLGVRCPSQNSTITDFGWGGTAGALQC